MNKAFSIILIPSLLLCTSCIRFLGALRPAPTTSTVADTTPIPNPSPEAKTVSSCEAKKADYRAKGADLREEPVKNVTIERQFQRIIRKGCDGEIIKDSVETVKSPTALVTLQPERRIYRKVGYVKIFDTETCVEREVTLPSGASDWLGQWVPVSGKDDGTIRVKMDLAEAWLTFKVTTGLNHLYYIYYDTCDAKATGGMPCRSEDEVAVGSYKVVIDYKERTLPPRVIEASAESCAKKQ